MDSETFEAAQPCEHHWISSNDGMWCTKCLEEQPLLERQPAARGGAVVTPTVVYPKQGGFFTEWWVTCAHCGNEHPCGARSRHSAEQNALRDGWAKIRKWFCPKCLIAARKAQP